MRKAASRAEVSAMLIPRKAKIALHVPMSAIVQVFGRRDYGSLHRMR
jgi:hypothetical protein